MASADEKLLVRWKARTDLIWLCNNILNFRDVTPKLSGVMVSRLFQFPRPASIEEMKVHDHYDAKSGKWIYRPLIVDESRLPGMLPDPNKMGGVRRTLSLDSRGYLKSSVVDVAHSVQWIINYPDITILLFQGNLMLGQQFVGDVKNAFWKNSMMHEYFPELCCPMDEDKFGNLDEFTIPGRSIGYTRKQPTMRARAIEQGGAGQHVEVIKYSDIVNEDNHESKEYCAKISDRFYNSQNTLIAQGKYWIDMDGTRYSTHDVYGEVIRREMERQSVTAWRCGKEIFQTKEGAAAYAKITKRPIHKVEKHYTPQPEKRLWNIYINTCYEVAHANPTFDYDDMLNTDLKFKIGEDGLPVSRWPERFSSADLEEEREHTPQLFACQKLNNPAGAAQDRKFPVVEGQYPSIIDRKTFNEEVRISHYEMAVDTAPTVGRRSDYTSIVVAATDSNGRVFIVEIIHGKFHEEETAEKILDAFKRYRPTRILMENDNGNRGIRVWLQRIALLRNLGYVPYVDVPRRMDKKGKQFRISETLRPWYMDGHLRFVVEEIEYSRGEKGELIKSPMWSTAQYHLLEEIRQLTSNKFHDDIVDSIAMLFFDRRRLGRLQERPNPSEEYNKHIMGKRAKMMEEARERAIFGGNPFHPTNNMPAHLKVTGGL